MEPNSILLKHIVLLAKQFNDIDERIITKLLLIELGIPSRLSGFDMIIQAVSVWRTLACPRITKDVYPVITRGGAKVNHFLVERSIRTAIHSAYVKRDETWSIFFPMDAAPTNTEFVSRLAAAVDIWQDCCLSLGKEGEL